MPIYSKKDLFNKYVQLQASDAFNAESISDRSFKNIVSAYPSSLYTPNTFVRIALAILTLVIIIFSGGLMALIFGAANNDALTGLLLFFAAASYAALEILVQNKKYFNAGVDNLLLFSIAAFVVAALMTGRYANQNTIICAVTVVVCLLLAVRFVDSFMAVLGYLSLCAFTYFSCSISAIISNAGVPFLLMALSVITYLLAKKLSKKRRLLFYRQVFQNLLLFTTISFYGFANYYVAEHISGTKNYLHPENMETIPFGSLFWLLTFTIPLVYVAYGIYKRELVMIRTGLILSVLTICTFRYYYSLIPIEMAMLFGGSFLIAVSYLLIKYFTTPKHGYSFNKNKHKSRERIDLKSLIITQAAGPKPGVTEAVGFGGGSFGSGGAGGTY